MFLPFLTGKVREKTIKDLEGSFVVFLEIAVDVEVRGVDIFVVVVVIMLLLLDINKSEILAH